MSTKEDRRRVGLRADRKVAPLLKVVEGKSTVNGLSTSRASSNKTRTKDEDEPPKSTKKTKQSNALKSNADKNTKARKSNGKELLGGKKRASSPPIEDPTRPPESSSDSSDSEADIPTDIPSQYGRLPRETRIGNSQSTKPKQTRSSQPDAPSQPYTGTAFRGAARPRKTPSYGTKKEIPETQSQSSEIESKSQSGLMSHMDSELGVLSQSSRGKGKGRATYGGSSQSRKVSSSAPEKKQVKKEKNEGKKEFKVFNLAKEKEEKEEPKKTFKTYETFAASQESEKKGKKTFRTFRGVSDGKESPIEKKKTFRSYGPSESLGSSGSEKRAFRTVDGILKDEDIDDSDSDADLNLKYPAEDADTNSDDSSRPSPRKKRLVDDIASPPKKPRSLSNSSTSSSDDTKTLCPMCGTSVPLTLLLAFTPNRPPSLSTRQQAAFCTHHRRFSALATSSALGYPAINWPQLPQRIATHFPYVARLLAAPDSTPSHYRGVLAADVAAGRNRTLKQSIMGEEEKVLVPGYYGARGARVMQERLLERFGDELRREAVRDAVVSARGVGGYVAGVLVLEVGLRLVGEDLGLEVEKEGDGWMEQARRRMEESAAWGTLVNVEVEEG